jgi:Protein of unknown function (DUF2975)
MSHPLPATDPLRHQIGWLCQFVRFTALAYGSWVVYSVITLWLDKAIVANRYGNWLKADLSGISDLQQFGGFALHAVICLFVVAACYAGWKLFSNYLEGRIFTTDAAILMQRVGMFGLIAELADIFFRPLVTFVVSMHLPTGHRMVGLAINQNDLVFMMLFVAIITLGHIFKKASEIATDNESIV